jgi:hypothetical protein
MFPRQQENTAIMEETFSEWSVPRCYKQDELADSYILKLQRLQNKVLHTIGNFARCAPVSDLHTPLNLPYVYDYTTKLCRQQAEVIQNHKNEHVPSVEQGEARRRKYKRLKLSCGQA